MAKTAKRDSRRKARLERRAQEEAMRRRGRQMRLAWIAGGAVVLAGLVGFAVVRSRSAPDAAAPSAAQPAGQPAQAGTPDAPTAPATSPAASPTPAARKPVIISVADQGRTHVAPGESHPAYTSNPPASGWHYAGTAPWGFHNGELPDELLIHNLEHGGIWITYKDDQDASVVDPLVALAREFPRKLVVTHRPKNDSPLAVVAWGRLMTLDRYDRAAIVDFYNRFKNKGPEFVPD
jgi:hypothetical protein